MDDEGFAEEEIEIIEEAQEETDWLAIARDAYSTGNDYFNSSIRTQIQKNIAAFNSKHPSGSKYNSDAYKYRSK